MVGTEVPALIVVMAGHYAVQMRAGMMMQAKQMADLMRGDEGVFVRAE